MEAQQAEGTTLRPTTQWKKVKIAREFDAGSSHPKRKWRYMNGRMFLAGNGASIVICVFGIAQNEAHKSHDGE